MSQELIPDYPLDNQKQKLNQLVELISEQQDKLNRLKALRQLAKEQAVVNVELNNELKNVRNSISEKDKELQLTLNRVDNLNRQLNNYRRTRTFRNSKNVAADKQLYANRHRDNQKATLTDPSDSNINNNISYGQVFNNASGELPTSEDKPKLNDPISPKRDAKSHKSSPPPPSPSPDSRSSDSNSINLPDLKADLSDEATTSDCISEETKTKTDSISESTVIPAKRDLKQNDPGVDDVPHSNHYSSDSRSKESASNNAVSSTTGNSSHFVQNHPSPAINKYANRQKLISSGSKSKSLNGRRVSFDPLALLLDAAIEGELDLVIKTSKQVSDLSASHEECVTALHNAVVAGHYEVAKFLIEAGCDINVQDSDGWTPLHCAASCNNLPMVKLLIENGALIYATTTSDHSTPAMKCEKMEEGFEDCYKYLMFVQNNLGVINDGTVFALYDYEAQEDDELSFVTGDELIVLRRDDSQEQEWWWAQKRTQQSSDKVVEIKEGYIPRNLVGLYPRVEAFRAGRKTKETDTGCSD